MTNQDIDRISATPLNFVIGKERSGTTLLQVMLNAHSNIVAPPESRFIISFYSKYGSKKQWTEKDLRVFCNELYIEKIFSNYWNIDKEKLYSSLAEVKEELNYPLLCKIIFYHFAPIAKDIKLFVDKNPLYYCSIPELNEIFPSAKFIHIVRDYRANILSHKRVVSINLNMADMAYRWMKVNKLVEAAKKRVPEQWFTLKYESLVSEPDIVMQQVCSFMNIPFEKSMIEAHNTKLFPSFYENNDRIEFKRFHGKVFEPISTSFIDEWKSVITPKELDVIESIAGEYAWKTYGYKKYSGNKNYHISALQMSVVKLKYFLIMKYFRALLKHRWAYYMHRYVIRYLLKNI